MCEGGDEVVGVVGRKWPTPTDLGLSGRAVLVGAADVERVVPARAAKSRRAGQEKSRTCEGTGWVRPHEGMAATALTERRRPRRGRSQ